MRCLVALCVVLLGCGKVSPGEPDAPVGDDDVVDAAAVDARRDDIDAFVPDAGTCQSDDFGGAALSGSWDPAAVGEAPSYGVDQGVLTISAAGYAATNSPGLPGETWINDFDTDFGNQMEWLAPVGTGDFTLTVHMGWSSSQPELTWGMIGMVDVDHHLEVLAGPVDGQSGGYMHPIGRIRVAGAGGDVAWDGGTDETVASTSFTISRTAGVMVIKYGDTPVLSQVNTADLQGLVISTAAYSTTANGQYAFGTVVFDDVTLCY